MPKTIEAMMTKNTADSQLKNAEPGPVTSGSVHTPSDS